MYPSLSLLRQRAFQFVIAACTLFVVLTTLGMLTYPGGGLANPDAPGYSFFTNFLSELGATVTPTGQPNTVSAVLFAAALSLAGLGLAVFFLVFPGFFQHGLAARLLSWIGSGFGILSAACFIGVALTPYNINLTLHGQFVLWAFSLFPIAVTFYIVVMLIDRRYPRRYLLVVAAFDVLLVLYYILMTSGPQATTPQGLAIQVTGQKIIAYASIVSILVQSFGALSAGHGSYSRERSMTRMESHR